MKKKNYFIGFLTFTFLYCLEIQTRPQKSKLFNKVIIWGHPLHKHTHSYIHWGFYRAFKYLGYETHWLTNEDNLRKIDFSNALFITEGQVDQRMPLRDDCFYVVHYGDARKYKNLFNKGRYVALDRYDAKDKQYAKPIDAVTAFNVSTQTIYIPWATDLLPHEIDKVKEKVPTLKKENVVWWIGTIGGKKFGNITELNPFKKACQENKLDFRNRFTHVSLEAHKNYIQKSYMAPAIVGPWQRGNGYLPCRIFKNISYGQPGATNSKAVYDLFKNDGIEIVYNPNTYQLFYDTKKYIATMTLEDLYKQMDYVRDNHTYLNRIERLIEFIELVYKERNPRR